MSNIASRGSTMAVDWEQRIDFAKLRADRLARARNALERSELGALLLFDPNNIRYVTSTHIGEWARDKNARFVLLPRSGDPILWDFGSAARHHQLYAPWLPQESFRAGVSPMRGAMPDETGVPDTLASTITTSWPSGASAGEQVGIDMTDIVTLNALHRAGVSTADGSQVMLQARAIKTEEEVALLDHAAAIVDAVYERIYEMLRPGVTERQIVAEAHRLLFELGSEQVEAINAVSGDRCNPHPHVFSDRLLRPGDQAFFDIIHSFMGYRTCYYRTFSVGGTNQAQLDAYKQCREWLDDAIDLVKPGVTTDEIAAVWPTAQELGFADEASCFGLQFGHGLGVGPVRVADDLPPAQLRQPGARSRRGWCSRSRPTARRATGSRRRGSRRRCWSPPTATGSSRASPPTSCWWPGAPTSAGPTSSPGSADLTPEPVAAK